MGKTTLIPVVALLALSAITAGCTGAGCIDGRTGVPKAEFRSSATGAAVRIDSVRISGVDAPGDSALLAPPKMVSTIYLPLRSDRPATAWCIHYCQQQLDDPRLNDTLTFHYDTTPYFVSDDCGVGFRYNITSLSCTHHLIDSVQLIEPLVTTLDLTHVAIYFRTQQ